LRKALSAAAIEVDEVASVEVVGEFRVGGGAVHGRGL
jgi:hypothetical protein